EIAVAFAVAMAIEGALSTFADLDAESSDEAIDMREAFGQILARLSWRQQSGTQFGWHIDLVNVEDVGGFGEQPLGGFVVLGFR
ncbi:hypothetical protein ABTH44_18465, partial [Acinetobacter baumannii]